MEFEHTADFRFARCVTPRHVIGKRVEQKEQHAPCCSGRRLDDVGRVMDPLLTGLGIFAFLIEVGQWNTGVLRVFLEIVIGAAGDSLELSPAPRVLVFNVVAIIGVVSKFVRFVLTQSKPQKGPPRVP